MQFIKKRYLLKSLYCLSLVCAILFSAHNDSNAQNVSVDDVKKYDESIQDSLYYEIFKSNRISDPKLALSCALKAYELSKKFEHIDIFLKAANAIGWLYQEGKKFDSALLYHNKGLAQAIKYDRKDRQMYTYNNLGLIYNELRFFDRALENYFKGLRLSRELNNIDTESSCLNNIGVAYSKVKNNNEALFYFKQCVDLIKDPTNQFRYSASINVGLTYIDLGLPKDAISTFNSLLSANQPLSMKIHIYSGLSNSYFKLNDIERAKYFARMTLDSAIRANDEYYVASSYHKLGKIAYSEKEYTQALKNLNQALTHSYKASATELEHDVKFLLSEVLSKQGKFEQAYNDLHDAYALNDSLHKEDFPEKFKNFHVSLVKEKADEEIQHKEAQIEKQQIISISTGVIALLILSFTVVLWKSTNTIKRSRNDLATANQTIATQNQNLVKLNESLESLVKERTQELALSLEKLRVQSEREKSLLQMEFNFLKNQFNSHITFNFLNYCYSKIHKLSDEAADAIDLFASMLRYSLSGKFDEKVTLASEIEYIENFIKLQRLLTSEVYVRFTCHGNMNGKYILPRVLITFIENAFKHGKFDSAEEPIEISLHAEEQTISLQVQNKKSNRKHLINTGVGRENVRKILELYYAGHHELIINEDNEFYSCTLHLNLNQEQDQLYERGRSASIG